MPATGPVLNELERCIIQLLEATSDAIISLPELQAAVEVRLAARAPGPASLLAGIERRPDLFLVLTQTDSLPGASTWPRETRARYDVALSSAGLRADTHIALRRDASTPAIAAITDTDVLRVLQHSVLRLWRVHENPATPGFDGAVHLFDTLRTVLHSSGDAE